MSAVVVGGGLAGFIAANRLRDAGVDAVVLEAQPHIGGMISKVEIGGATVDGGAEAYATRSTAARELCERLGLEIAGPSGRPHVWWPDQIVPLADGMLGIPASFDDAALDVLTPEERERARKDLEIGPDPGSDATTLGELVATRMGMGVVEKMVAPLATGVFHTPPMQVPLAVFAPRLLGAMKEQGSLQGAVAALRTPGSSNVEQPVGGMFRLVEELAKDIEVRTSTPALRLRRNGHGFIVETHDGPLRTDRIIMCTPAAQTRHLLADIGMSVPEIPTRSTRIVLLTSTHPALAEGPVGSGLLMGERDPRILARALTHYSVKWPWTTGDHVLRLSYPGEIDPPRPQIVDDASRLTGVDLEDTVTGCHTITHEMPGKLDPGTRNEILTAAEHAGVELLGAWLDGNGISPIIEAGARIA